MLQVTKHNFEGVYLDYLEGNLNEEGKALLFSFFEKNPDCKAIVEEDGDLLDYKISAKKEVFKGKSTLKFDLNVIDEHNIDFWMISEIEGDLDDVQIKKVQNFIIENKLEYQYKVLSATILKPDLNIVFDRKGTLKKKSGIIVPLFYRVVAVAAAIVLIFSVLNFDNSSVDHVYSSRENSHDFIAPNTDVDAEIKLKKPVDIEIETSPNSSFKNIAKEKNIKIDTNFQNQLPILPKDDIAKIEFKKEVHITPIDTVSTIPNHPKNEKQPDKIVPKFKDVEEAGDLALVEQKSKSIELNDQLRPITKTINNHTGLDVTYKKTPKRSDYDITQFSVGRFSFERKKKKN